MSGRPVVISRESAVLARHREAAVQWMLLKSSFDDDFPTFCFAMQKVI
jgi:hypothetical protein